SRPARPVPPRRFSGPGRETHRSSPAQPSRTFHESRPVLWLCPGTGVSRRHNGTGLGQLTEHRRGDGRKHWAAGRPPHIFSLTAPAASGKSEARIGVRFALWSGIRPQRLPTSGRKSVPMKSRTARTVGSFLWVAQKRIEL